MRSGSKKQDGNGTWKDDDDDDDDGDDVVGGGDSLGGGADVKTIFLLFLRSDIRFFFQPMMCGVWTRTRSRYSMRLAAPRQ